MQKLPVFPFKCAFPNNPTKIFQNFNLLKNAKQKKKSTPKFPLIVSNSGHNLKNKQKTCLSSKIKSKQVPKQPINTQKMCNLLIIIVLALSGLNQKLKQNSYQNAII
eukprot:TRINITY_DN10162_c1_g1_i2.p5 TRINITY_DN10162_c1_g1~~TRINITY_DN10162_c1_g1_i2.p5  ORF type:complete len:107 (-),score=2.67 TRINITY_DN10162_c1_g1_i2:113-433(-)